MKILAISLLRLGDCIMHGPAIKALKQRYNDCEVDLLVNEQFLFLESMMTDVDRFIGFPRKELQQLSGKYESQIFEPVIMLENFVRNLGDRYDIVVNLTQNRLSGYLCSLINANEKIGLCLDSDGKPSFGNAWFRYLNEESSDKPLIHFTDIFARGCGAKKVAEIELKRTKSGIEEATAALKGLSTKVLAIQGFTSDERKNWGDENFAKSIQYFLRIHSEFSVVLLAAPSEEGVVRRFAKECQSVGVEARPIVCSLDGALSILDNCEILLTGDTSIKHLASATKCKIVELSVGPSVPQKTGAYSEGAIIVAPRMSCSPCAHSGACSEVKFNCHESIPPEAISMILSQVVLNNRLGLKDIANEYSDLFRIFWTQLSEMDIWTLTEIGKNGLAEEIQQKVRVSGLKLMLDGSHLKFISSCGSEGESIERSLLHKDEANSYDELKSMLSGLEDELFGEEEILTHLKFELGRVFRAGFEGKMLSEFDEEMSLALRKSRLLQRVPVTSKATNLKGTSKSDQFLVLRRTQNFISSAGNLNELEKKLVRSIKNKVLER